MGEKKDDKDEPVQISFGSAQFPMYQAKHSFSTSLRLHGNMCVLGHSVVSNSL